MDKIKKIILILILFNLFLGCQSLRDGLEGNKKSKSGEEFLIEKKNPLVLPPDYSKLPVPKDKSSENDENNEFDLQKVITKSPDTKTSSNNEVNKTLKNSILDKIKNN
tara:strand:+ start:95 stop:418 length:324 start_codon:yes stop_codon:yes gene_type:complete